MADVGQGMQGGRGKAAFRFQHGMGPGGKDEVAFHVGQGSQMAQQTQGQGHAAGTADAYDDSFHKSSLAVPSPEEGLCRRQRKGCPLAGWHESGRGDGKLRIRWERGKEKSPLPHGQGGQSDKSRGT